MNKGHTYRRGAFRGRSAASVRGRGTSSRPVNQPPRNPEPLLSLAEAVPVDRGEVIQVISNTSLAKSTSETTVVRDVEAVASYNWLYGVEKPTIAIPGAPPRWTPPSTVPQLSQDPGVYYRDVNAAHFPKSPLRAQTLSILACGNKSTKPIDLVACAVILRLLFLFTRGESKTFRIIVKAVKGTVFLIRQERSPDEVIPDVRGYGHTMPEACTTWHRDVRGSVSHQRVIRFTFAGMNCLLRYEPDGYLPDKLPADSPVHDTWQSEPCSMNLDIGALIQAINISPPPDIESTADGITVKSAGCHIHQSAVFELKTRSIKRKEEDFFDEYAIRLWLTQTPYFIQAYHTSGMFNDISIRDVRADVVSWESRNQPDIKRFASLIEQITRLAKAEPGGALELWRHKDRDLELRRPKAVAGKPLPTGLEELRF